MEKIKTTAKAFGTFNSPTDGQILYIDPNHSLARHNAPELTAAEAKRAFEMGLIDDPEGAKVVKDADDTNTAAQDDPNLIGNVAAARTADVADIDADVDGGKPSTLDSRQSTAWPDNDRVQGGVAGSAATNVDDSGANASSDVDAPPAKKPAAAKAAAPKGETKA